MCQVHDIREIGDFIQMFLYDGFTLECLSKTMNIPIEWLEECVSDNPPKEVKKLLDCTRCQGQSKETRVNVRKFNISLG